MNVPNHEKKAFREMTAEERSAIVEAWINVGIEYLILATGDWIEKDGGNGSLSLSSIYRTKPRQLIIPWDVIKTEYEWAAMDMDRVLILHKEKPIECGNGWSSESECVVDMLNIDTTGINWRESLVQRPEGV